MVSSNALGQLIAVLSLPVLTRLYAPSDFGVLASLSAAIMIGTAVSTLRYEIPIPNATNAEEARHLIIVASLNAAISSLAAYFLLSIEFLEKQLTKDYTDINHFALVISIGIFFSSLFNVVQFYAIRERLYKTVSMVRVGQAFGGNGLQVVLGYFSWGPVGLVIGFLAQTAGGSATFIRHFLKNPEYRKSALSIKKLLNTYKEYSRYPQYSTAEALLHMSSLQLPLLLIGSLVSVQEAGLIFMANRIIQLPVGVVSGSIAQVFSGELPERIKLKQGRSFFLSTARRLLIFGGLPTLALGIFAYTALSFVLGQQWSGASWMVLSLSPLAVLQMVASATGGILYAAGQEHIALRIHFNGFIVRMALLGTACLLYKEHVFAAYVLGGMFHYCLYLYYVNKASLSVQHFAPQPQHD